MKQKKIWLLVKLRGFKVYAVELSQRADKYLQKLDSHLRKRITERLKNLEVTPVPKDTKFIYRDEGGKSF